MTRLLPTDRFDLPDGFTFTGVLKDAGLEPSRRSDGWTPDRQRDFLAALAEGATVEKAAAQVGLSPQSAYALRQRAAGATFALGWHAALLLQRQKLADELTGRAFAGQVDTLTRADGSVVERHRHDNRLGLALLARLDRIAAGENDRHGDAQSARLVAGEWQRYLDLVEQDASPAQAGLFLAARTTAVPGQEDVIDALAPVMALARADLYARTRAGTPDEVDTADLDPARRADWSAGQWARAEAAGLLVLAPTPPPPPGPARESQLPQHSKVEARKEEPRVWYDQSREDWRTDFAPPPDFYGSEQGRFGEAFYERSLTREEELRVEPARRRAEAERYARHAAVRDAWFAAQPEPDPDWILENYDDEDDDDDYEEQDDDEDEDRDAEGRDAPPRDGIDGAICDTPPPPSAREPRPNFRYWDEIEAEDKVLMQQWNPASPPGSAPSS